ncbi:hypothetical protein GCM10009682_61090 [Luedemannella flava]|uniref:Nucleotidyltransferase AbiEii toxin of type IV toxin-antitoxin system n=1 Tax=Luedemannella flava TaxID=349316 RepID=A0ABP4Z1F0_9ACTN
MLARHRAITQIALAAGGPYGLALAGGYAVSEHGMGERPSGDVDLFTDWHRRGDFPAAVDAVIAALAAQGYTVTAVAHTETFARLLVATTDSPDDPDKMELSADWRAHPPVILDVGPVLHPDDAVANKMTALFGRAEARDFLDVDAALASGRYTRQRLVELAANADGGFDPILFADAIGSLAQRTDAEFADYEVTAQQISAVRRRFAEWRDEILKQHGTR